MKLVLIGGWLRERLGRLAVPCVLGVLAPALLSATLPRRARSANLRPPARPRATLPSVRRAERSAPPEARALWVSRFDYDSEEKIAQIMEAAARAHFNIIYFQARAAGDAFYHSSIEPCAVLLCGRLGGTPGYDPLAAAVREAHRRGLELHAWLNALPGQAAGIEGECRALEASEPGNPRHVLLKHPEWTMIDQGGRPLSCPNGEEYVWLSPGYPGVRTQLARVAADVARRYEIDGIHLDRIRYPGSRWSYDAASLVAFGDDPATHVDAWRDFRSGLVSRMVRETFDSITAVRPTLVLSAAVWGIYDDHWNWQTMTGVRDLFQDPRRWARDGYLDVAVPMTYFRIKPTYCARADWTCLLDDHVRGIARATGRHVYIGIDASQGAAEVVRQIRLARARGATGVSIFSYTAAERAGLWPLLAQGVFAERASVPSLPWKQLTSRTVVRRAERSRNTGQRRG